MDVSDVVEAERTLVPPAVAGFNAVVAPFESANVSATARVVAMAATPTTPTASEARRARRRRHPPTAVSRYEAPAPAGPKPETSEGWRHNRSSGESQPRCGDPASSPAPSGSSGMSPPVNPSRSIGPAVSGAPSTKEDAACPGKAG